MGNGINPKNYDNPFAETIKAMGQGMTSNDHDIEEPTPAPGKNIRLSDFHKFDPCIHGGITVDALRKSWYANKGVVFPKVGLQPAKGLNAIAGYADIKKTIEDELTGLIINPPNKNFFRFGLADNLEPDRGLFFYGPPGNGKTFIVDKVIEELGANRFDISNGKTGSPFINRYEINIVNIFDDARRIAKKTGKPSIVVIDEAESVAKDRDEAANYEESVTNTLLAEMSSSENDGVYVLLMSNKPNKMDIAALRNGRINTPIEIGMPNEQTRLNILEHLMSQYPYSKYDDVYNAGGINLKKIAEITDGYTVSDLVGIINKARRNAVKVKLQYIDDMAMNIAVKSVRKSLTDVQIAEYEEASRLFNEEFDR